MILKKKKCYFEEKLGKNRNNPKEIWKTLKSLGLSLDKAKQSKISLNAYRHDINRSFREHLIL